MSIRDILKQIIAEAQDKRPRVGAPCVKCGKITANFCGVCVRAGIVDRVHVCSHEESAACGKAHATERHSRGQVGERDPEWIG